MKNTISHILLVFFFSTMLLNAQNEKPCSTEEGKQFDFWVGEWQATWDGGQGVNKISKILNSCVIFEEFDGRPSSPLIGKSFSVYNTRTGNWRQTWVDNSGGYLDFIGKWQDDKMILSRSLEIKGVKTIQRMVWYNISKDKFDWNWEKSTDDGNTWTVSWQIHYIRDN